jgi:hypothetical protein
LLTLLLSSFFLALSWASYVSAFLQLKASEESHHLKFQSGATEPYNSPSCVTELKSASIHTRDTSPGPDAIHNQMFTHMLHSVLLFLLNMCYCIWSDADLLWYLCYSNVTSTLSETQMRLNICLKNIALFLFETCFWYNEWWTDCKTNSF